MLNAAAYTHTSVAILDAITAVRVPVIEVHITNIHARESFRATSYVSRAAQAMICGFGIDGYALAITGLAALTRATLTGSKGIDVARDRNPPARSQGRLRDRRSGWCARSPSCSTRPA